MSIDDAVEASIEQVAELRADAQADLLQSLVGMQAASLGIDSLHDDEQPVTNSDCDRSRS